MARSDTYVDLSRLIGKKGCYEILSYLKTGRNARFNEIRKATGISCLATLSHALRQLHKAGLIDRKTRDIRGASLLAFYVISNKGKKVLTLIEELKRIEETSV